MTASFLIVEKIDAVSQNACGQQVGPFIRESGSIIWKSRLIMQDSQSDELLANVEELIRKAGELILKVAELLVKAEELFVKVDELNIKEEELRR